MHSIRFRLTLTYTCCLLFITILLGLIVRSSLSRELYAQIDRDLAYRCQAIAEEIKEGPSLPEQHTAYEGPLDAFGLARPDGTLILERGPRLLSRLRSDSSAAGTVDSWRWASSPVKRKQEVLGIVMAAHRPDEVRAALVELNQTLAALLPVVLLLGAFSGWWLAGRALAPVESLTEAIVALSERRLDERLPVNRDELGGLARAFNQLLERLDLAFARQRQFTADASHELRTPLAVIQAAASQHALQPRTPDETTTTIRRIQKAAESMHQLLNSLLFLARSDDAPPALEWTTVDLADFLEAVSDSCAEMVPGLSIHVHGQGRARLDLSQMTSLITNLLENAALHGQARRVDLHIAQTEKSVILTIQDDGRGVAAEHLPRLLERFYQADKARSGRGSGLGLSICASIARLHGGTFRLESPDQGGLKATLEILLTNEGPTTQAAQQDNQPDR